MNRLRTAIKRLTQSDLSFFKVHLKLSKQKAINLNSNVFIESYFPGLSNSFDNIHLQLSIIGPGNRQQHNLSRKILRSQGSKNWRLNGEFIYNPEEDPIRYDSLIPDDYAILIFEGAERPTAITMILVGKNEDRDLHLLINEEVNIAGKNTMVDVSSQEILKVLERISFPEENTNILDYVNSFNNDTVEDVLYGNNQFKSDQQITRRFASLTHEQLQRQMQTAQETGRYGEEIFRAWLIQRGQTEENFKWISNDSARSSYDYEITMPFWMPSLEKAYIDVKTTKSHFDQPFHMSLSEIKFASRHENYRIARIFDLNNISTQVYILSGIAEIAKKILDNFSSLPGTVAVDSISLVPSQFNIELKSVVEILS